MREPHRKNADVSAMRDLRAQGMTNDEIAETLGTTRETVWNNIGAGPRPKTYTKHTKSMAELFSGVSTEVTLNGKSFVYKIHPDKQEVTLGSGGFFDIGAVTLDVEALGSFIDELLYIRRMYMRGE